MDGAIVADVVPPMVDSAKVIEDGTKIEIVFNEGLDTNSVPLASAFAVTVDGATSAITPSGVDIPSDDATTVVLSMPTADTIAAGATVTVTYTDSDASPLQDLATDKNQVETFTDQAVTNRPAAPTGLTLIPGDDRLEASWTAPTDIGGSTITSYEVQYKPASAPDSDYTTVSRTDPDALTQTITGPTNNTQYTVRVAAVNEAGTGPWSTEESATPETPPAVISALVDIPNLDEIVLTYDKALDTSTSSTPAADAFEVRVDGVAGVAAAPDNVEITNANTVTLTMAADIAAGAEVFVSYTIPVNNKLVRPTGQPAPSFTYRAVLSQPGAPEVSLTSGDTEIIASWPEPALGHGSNPTYEVQYSLDDDDDEDKVYQTVVRDDEAALTETITGLDNNKRYTVRVRVGTDSVRAVSPWSVEMSATPSAVVSAPSGLDLLWGNTKVLVRWIPPADIAGDSSVDGWLVQWRQSGSTEEWSADRQSSVDKLHDDDDDDTADWLSFEKLVDNLTNDTEYEFRVRARVQADRAAEWTADGATATPKVVTPDVPGLKTANLFITSGEAGLTSTTERVTVHFYDEPVRSVVGGLAVYTVRRTFYYASDLSTPAYPLTEVRFEIQLDSTDPPPIRTITTLHAGTGPDDWGGFDYPPSYIDVLSSQFRILWDVLSLDGSTANGDVHDFDGAEGPSGSMVSVIVDQEKAVLEAPVGVDGGLEITWQPLLWAGTALYEYQLCVQWKSGDEDFYAAEDLAPVGTVGIGDRAIILTGDALTDALRAASYTLTGLDNGTTYTVRVAYCNDSNDVRVYPDLISNEVSGTPVDLTAPSVDSAKVVEDGKKVEIVFDEDLDSGSTVAAGEFGVTVGAASAVEPSGAALSAVDADTVVLTMTAAIAAGETVTVDYEAPSTGGLTDASNNQVADFSSQVVANRPAAPTGLTLEPGAAEIVASWAAPANGGSTITGYEVQYKVFNTADSTYLGVSRAQDDTAVTETITNLTNDTQYTVRVRAANAVGDGPWSDEVSATPEAPPVLQRAQVDADAPTDIVLTYDKDLDTSKVPAASAFTVTEMPRGGTPTSLTESSVAIDSANADTVTLTMDAELTAGFDVVVAYLPPDSNALQSTTGHEAASFTNQAVLNRPAAPVVTLTPGDEQITASWPAPADGGSAITGYTVEYKLATDADTAYQEVTRTEGDTARTDTITGLTNDTTYTVRVRATNAAGDSPNSNEPTDTPQLLVTAEFEAGSYVALEGRGAVTVTVTLSVAPERSVTIPIVVTPDGGATSDDYTVSADTVTFHSDDTEATFTVTAEDDTVWDGEGNGETLTLSFGTLPPRVDPGTQATAEVSLIDNEIPLHFELVPDDIGIGVGDGFRLLFVTSGKRNAESSSISAYNEFVQRAAASGHNDIRPYSSLIRALASTATVWARDNTATTHTNSERGVPIWWLNGPRAADDYADFYYIDSPPTSPGDGWDHGDPAYNENGTVELAGDPCDLADYVWTGSDSRGRTHSNRSLGFTGQARVGRPCTQGRELSFQDAPSSNRWPLYGLSDVLHVVAPDVPYVTGVEVDPVPDYDQFAVGDTIRVKVTFSEAVTVSGTPTFPLQIGSGTRDAVYQGADADSTDTVLVFTYVVGDVDTDTDKDGISNAEQTLGLPTNASIVDMTDDTVDAFPGPITLSTDFLVNGPPIIIDVEVTSSPQADSSNDTYGLGEDIEITVTFHEAVTVTGDVDFGLSVNGPRRAPLKSGNGTTEPVFAYTVQTGDDDDNGIWIGHPTHATNPTFDLQAEQSVVGVGSGLPALLEHDSVGPQADHKVDGSNTEADTTLSALSLSDGGADLVLVPAFAPGAAGTAVTSFVAMTDATSIVVSATASQSGGSSAVAISPADADANTTDHDVERTLDEVIDIIVTVTSTNGSSTRIYTVTVVEPDTTAPLVSQARVFDDGNKIEIVFDEDLATGSTVAADEFDPRRRWSRRARR